MIDSGGSIEANLARIRAGVERACGRSGRDPAEVRIVAVTKTVPAQRVRIAHEAGVDDFGENYVKELAAKRAAAHAARWHYVGALQSNTARHVVEHADVVHTLERGRAVRRLAGRAESADKRIPALIQVDLTGGRHGVAPADVGAFAREVRSFAGIELAGLMTLPPMPERPEDARPFFRRMRQLRDELREAEPAAVELSMGMSLDYEVAIEEGATMVRIGTALFGERAPAKREDGG